VITVFATETASFPSEEGD